MGIIKNISNELVINTHPVREFRSFQERIGKFFSHFRFKSPYGAFNGAFFKAIPNNKNVHPAVALLHKNTGNNQKLESPAVFESVNKLLTTIQRIPAH